MHTFLRVGDACGELDRGGNLEKRFDRLYEVLA